MPRKDMSHTLYLGNDPITARAAARVIRGDQGTVSASRHTTSSVALLQGLPKGQHQVDQRQKKIQKRSKKALAERPPFGCLIIMPAVPPTTPTARYRYSDVVTTGRQWFADSRAKKIKVLQHLYVHECDITMNDGPYKGKIVPGFMVLGAVKKSAAESLPLLKDMALHIARQLQQPVAQLHFRHQMYYARPANV